MQTRINEKVEKNKAFGKLFEQSSDGLLLLKDAKIIECNETSTSMLEMPNKENLLGLSLLEISPKFQPDGRKSSEMAQEMM